MRIGIGYDVHRLVEDRDLVLGGIKIDSPVGLLGHSDADVLTHAIMDAIIGAMALGDIGQQFPDTDPQYKDIDSTVLLSKVVQLMKEHGYKIGNVDTTVALERPKIGHIIPDMRAKLASVLDTNIESVSIKATTTEGLGFVGVQDGAAAYAVVLLNKIE